jgi:hypothetical protein
MRRRDDDDEQIRYPHQAWREELGRVRRDRGYEPPDFPDMEDRDDPQIDPRRLEDYRFPQPWTQERSARHWNTGQPWGGGEPWSMGRRQDPGFQRRWERAGSYGYGQMAWPATDFGSRPDFRGKGPKGYQRPDERILDDLNERLTYDRLLDASEIECQVHNGEVTLLGVVPSRDAKRRAEDIAETVLGAKEVHNAIRVRREGDKEEQEPRWGAQSSSRPDSGVRNVQGGKQQR